MFESFSIHLYNFHIMSSGRSKQKITYDFFALLVQFIIDCQSGKRLLKNGGRMKPGTIKNYKSLNSLLKDFSTKNHLSLQIENLNNCTSRQFQIERNYWKKIYRRLTNYMYKTKNNHDNYVGTNFKLIRSFFNYLNVEKGIDTKQIQKLFYPISEEIPVIALNAEQINKLIYDKEFEALLPFHLKVSKDIFVFGCTVGLRYSDMVALKRSNIETVYNEQYLKVISKKTQVTTQIKLPSYAKEILHRYRKNKTFILPRFQLHTLNMHLRKIGELAGWTHLVEKKRRKRGILKEILTFKEGKSFRFCDLISSHTMRRTAITTLLNLGMPEHMVRKISGHASGSKEFFKYVQYSQNYIDQEMEKAHTKLKLLNNTNSNERF